MLEEMVALLKHVSDRLHTLNVKDDKAFDCIRKAKIQIIKAAEELDNAKDWENAAQSYKDI